MRGVAWGSWPAREFIPQGIRLERLCQSRVSSDGAGELGSLGLKLLRPAGHVLTCWPSIEVPGKLAGARSLERVAERELDLTRGRGALDDTVGGCVDHIAA